MYGVVRPIIPPLGVSYAVAGEFVNSGRKDIVLIKGTGIELYKVSQDGANSEMHLLSEVQLNGVVESCAVLRPPSCTNATLLLGFEQLRCSILQWSQHTHTWTTESMFSFQDLMREDNVDDEDVTTATLKAVPGLMRGRIASEDVAIVRTDHRGRCFAALARKSSKMFIVPVPLSRGRNGTAHKGPLVRKEDTFWLDLEEYGVQNVKDFVFLENTFEPCLCMIYEPVRTWSGRVAIHTNTVFALTFAIDISTRSHRKVWAVENLPYDAFGVAAAPESLGGGTVVTCASSVLFVQHGAIAAALTVNATGDALMRHMEEYHPSIRDTVLRSQAITNLDTARLCFLDPPYVTQPMDTAVLCLKAGEIYFLTIPRSLKLEHMRITRAGSSVIASQVLSVRPGLFVIASRIADTVLVQYERRVVEQAVEAGDAMDLDEELKEIFGDDGASRKRPVKETWSLKKRDTLPTLGPAADLAIGRNERAEAEDDDAMEPNGAASTKDHLEELEVIVAGGHGSSGGVTILERSLRPVYVTKRDALRLPGCRRAWTVRDPIANLAATRARERRNTAKNGRNAMIRRSNEQMLRAKQEWIESQKKEQESQLREQVESQRAAAAAREGEDKEPDEAAPPDEVPPPPDDATLAKMVEDLHTTIEEAGKAQFAPQEELVLEEPPEDEENLHSYLLLSNEHSTLVFESGVEIAELVEVDFRVDSPTIAAGNVLANRAAVQVHREGARLLRGRRLILDHALPHDAVIIAAQIQDPYVLLRLSNGVAVILEVQADEEAEDSNAQTSALTGTLGIGESLMDEYGGGLEDLEDMDEDVGLSNARMVQKFETTSNKHGFISACCLYSGPALGGKFNDTRKEDRETPAPDDEDVRMADEEYLLYGDADKPDGAVDADAHLSRTSEEDVRLFVAANHEGELQIFDVSDFKAVFLCKRFFLAPSYLFDEGDTASMETDRAPADGGASRVTDICMAPIGADYGCKVRVPVLVGILAGGGVVVYQAYVAPEVPDAEGGPGCHRMRFRKIVVDDITHEPGENPLIVSFENVGRRGGLFVTGERPFLVFGDRGYPRLHPLRVRPGSEVLHFAQLHNVICPYGFVTVERDGTVRIGALPVPGEVNLDTPWPLRKVPLRCSVHRLAYHDSTSTYGLLTSHLMPKSRDQMRKAIKTFSSQVQLEKEKADAQGVPNESIEEDDADASALAEEDTKRFSDRLPTYMEERHELQLYRPDTWEQLKKYALKEFEVGLSISSMVVDVYKTAKATSSGPSQAQQQKGEAAPSLFATSVKLRPKHMLVVGTGYLRGEDSPSRGRLLMFEVSKQERFTQDGKIATFQMQLIAEKELKGQVSAVQTLQGYVVVGVGPKVEVYKLVEDEIVCCSFFFAQLFCTSITSLKQYILVGDMFKSVNLLYWRDRNKSLNFLGKDYEPLETYATEFLLYDDDLSLLCSDARGNIQLFNYENATVAESRGGTRLLANGGFHVASRINRFQRVRAPQDHKGGGGSGASQQVVMFATLDCGLGAVVPVKEATYKRLVALHSKLCQTQDLPFYAGLNPKEFRTFRPQKKSHQLLNKRLLDGQVLLEFHLLDGVRKKDTCRQIGCSVEEVQQALEVLNRGLLRF